MKVPGVPSLFFLFFLLVVLPLLAVRSGKRLRSARAGALPVPTRVAIWRGTMFMQAALLLLSWLVGGTFGFRIFAMPSVRPLHVLAAAAALGLTFALRSIARAMRSPEELRELEVFRWAPREPRELRLWAIAVILGSVAEEAAYRGVGMSILWYSTGSAWVSVLICAVAFAIAHAAQGWKSGIVVFAVALIMHALVGLTGTLVLAMVIHAVYDLIAGLAISREAAVLDRAAAEETGAL